MGAIVINLVPGMESNHGAPRTGAAQPLSYPGKTAPCLAGSATATRMAAIWSPNLVLYALYYARRRLGPFAGVYPLAGLGNAHLLRDANRCDLFFLINKATHFARFKLCAFRVIFDSNKRHAFNR